MIFPSRSDWLFSLKAFIASMLALYIALLFDLPRPYWAMAAVYVVANPLAGATRSKAIYRALGTLIGAAASVVFLPIFINAPVLLAMVVSLWTGTLLYISMLDRTPRSYVFMLAGYSLPLIALPLVDSPASIFDTAVARSEEIIVGITCASLVNAVLFPSSVSNVLSARIADWMRDARQWATDILGGNATPNAPLSRQKLAADLSALDLFLTQISHDAASVDIVKQARSLRGRLLMLLPVLSSLSDRIHALKSMEGAVSIDLERMFGELSTWIAAKEGSTAPRNSEELRQRIEALKAMPAHSMWERLIRLNALARLRELVDLLDDCDALQAQIAAGRPDRNWTGRSRYRRSAKPVRHYDYPLMLFATSMVILGTLLSIGIWIMTGWGSGAGFVTMMAVACSFFAAIDRPAPFVRLMFVWTGASLIGAGLYLFAVLPIVHDFPTLVLAFAGPFILIGVLIPRPQFNIIAMLLSVNMASYVALQNRFSADFASFTNDGLAALLGVGFALVWTLLTRPFGEELAASRLVRSGWADLSETAAKADRYEQDVLSGRLLDRLGQLVPRLAKMDGHALAAIDGLAEVRIGFNILELQRERDRVGNAGALIDGILAETSAFFKNRVRKGIALPPPDILRTKIDAAITGLAQEKTSRVEAALNGLVGLRRALFPAAPPPEEADRASIAANQLHAAE